MKKLLIALLLGAVLYYLFDPNNGQRHRSEIRHKAESLRKDKETSSPEAA